MTYDLVLPCPTFNIEPVAPSRAAHTEAAVFADAAASLSSGSAAYMGAGCAGPGVISADVGVGNAPEPHPPIYAAPPGHVLIAQADIDRMLTLIAQLQNEREADRIDNADYERLLEKERVEFLEPLPNFLLEPNHRIPRLAKEFG